MRPAPWPAHSAVRGTLLPGRNKWQAECCVLADTLALGVLGGWVSDFGLLPGFSRMIFLPQPSLLYPGILGTMDEGVREKLEHIFTQLAAV